MAAWYLSSTGWTAVTAWAASTAYSVGDIRRQLAAPTVGQERVFRCTTAGTSGGAEPAPWTLTVGGTTNDNTAVWTEITGNSTYGWTAPHARLANAFASGWMAAGDTCYVGDDHAETQATAMTLTSPGTAASPCVVMCVDDSATPPTAAATTGVVICSSGAISFAGYCYSYGVTYRKSGTDNNGMLLNSASAWAWVIESGALENVTTGNSLPTIIIGGNGAIPQYLKLVNSNIKFGHVNQFVSLRGGTFEWLGGSLDGAGSIPTFLIGFGSNVRGTAILNGVNLLALDSGESLVSIATGNHHAFFTNCKLGASVAITTGSISGPAGGEAHVINSDSADTNYRYAKHVYQGVITQETTIVRTGGATNGTVSFSRKMVSSANSKFFSPLEGPWCYFENATLGAVTVAIETVTDNVTLTDAEAWIEVEHLGTTGFPLSVFERDRAADILATPANQTTSSETWTTTGLATPVKQTLSESVTPAEIGWIRARVMLAKASTTVYFCPKILSTSTYQYMTPDGSIINAAAAGGGLLRHPGMAGGLVA